MMLVCPVTCMLISIYIGQGLNQFLIIMYTLSFRWMFVYSWIFGWVAYPIGFIIASIFRGMVFFPIKRRPHND